MSTTQAEKRAINRERVAAPLRNALLEELTREPVVIHGYVPTCILSCSLTHNRAMPLCLAVGLLSINMYGMFMMACDALSLVCC